MSTAERIGLTNRCVPQAVREDATREWYERIKPYSSQTLRATRKSLSFESDELYASWQHGMELLAHVWGSEESLEGMQAFIDRRKPDFPKFRLRNKQQVEEYLAGVERGDNRKR